eukprot:TRINITY_DN410_c0_g1_i2.p1 TRINITY_DN410_c0_g1~~TRINITY_DN410_c0_g1_i2.p1  ORF type:complete len:109 (-),score=11.37 TRINITY_DN410_c0_g1_i2:84-410(-)
MHVLSLTWESLRKVARLAVDTKQLRLKTSRASESAAPEKKKVAKIRALIDEEMKSFMGEENFEFANNFLKELPKPKEKEAKAAKSTAGSKKHKEEKSDKATRKSKDSS